MQYSHASHMPPAVRDQTSAVAAQCFTFWPHTLTAHSIRSHDASPTAPGRLRHRWPSLPEPGCQAKDCVGRPCCPPGGESKHAAMGVMDSSCHATCLCGLAGHSGAWRVAASRARLLMMINGKRRSTCRSLTCGRAVPKRRDQVINTNELLSLCCPSGAVPCLCRRAGC